MKSLQYNSYFPYDEEVLWNRMATGRRAIHDEGLGVGLGNGIQGALNCNLYSLTTL